MRFISAGALALTIGLGACHGTESFESPPTPPATTDLAPPAAATAADLVVHPGESIQAAVDAATAGQRVLLTPGVYREAIRIDKPGIKLVGLGRRTGDRPESVVIENPGGLDNGITVLDAGDGVEIQNLVIRGFLRNGVILIRVNGFRLADLVADHDGEYGLFPIRSTDGVVERCTAIGHEDTGIYVGQSERVVVRESIAHGNVNGIEIENSSYSQVLDSEAYGNTAGIVIVLLPQLTVKTSTDILVRGNHVHDNNLPNFADGGFEQYVPAGSGILVVGTDRTTVRNNRVRGNSFVGIAVANTGLLAQLAGIPIDVEPFPDGARIANNRVTGNGGAQPIPFLPPGTDLLWDGTGTGTCFVANTFGTSLNLDLLGGSPSPVLPTCP